MSLLSKSRNNSIFSHLDKFTHKLGSRLAKSLRVKSLRNLELHFIDHVADSQICRFSADGLNARIFGTPRFSQLGSIVLDDFRIKLHQEERPNRITKVDIRRVVY